MIHTILPYNTVIKSMTYHNEVITIEFKKQNYKRVYSISMELAYRLFYTKSASECLKVYNEIKQKCTVLTVKNI